MLHFPSEYSLLAFATTTEPWSLRRSVHGVFLCSAAALENSSRGRAVLGTVGDVTVHVLGFLCPDALLMIAPAFSCTPRSWSTQKLPCCQLGRYPRCDMQKPSGEVSVPLTTGSDSTSFSTRLHVQVRFRAWSRCTRSCSAHNRMQPPETLCSPLIKHQAVFALSS